MSHSIKTILATAGLKAFPDTTRGTLMARAQKLCELSGSNYYSPGTKRFFSVQVHKLDVVADGAAFVALESFSQDDEPRLYRPVVIDCAGNVADTVIRDDCATDAKAAGPWFVEKVRKLHEVTYVREFVATMITRVMGEREYALKQLKRGLLQLTGTPLDMTSVNNDANGNARYVVHFLDLLTMREIAADDTTTDQKFQLALKHAKAIGGTAYRGREFGGGIVFSCYSREEIAEHVSRVTGRSFIAA